MAGEPWEQAVEREHAFLAAVQQMHEAGMAEQCRRAMRTIQGREMVLRLLLTAPIELTMDLLPEVFELGTTTHRQVVTARRVLARLDPGWLAFALSSPVDELLGRTDLDYADYRRTAELLDHLQQEELLGRVVAAAATSDDPDIREVADDYGSRPGPS